MTNNKNMKTPKNKQWIVALGNDDFKYHPSLELISACKKAKIKGFKKKETAEKHCNHLNSL